MKNIIKNIKTHKNILLFSIISLIGILFYAPFFLQIEVLRNADGLAYIRMAEFLQQFSEQGLWTGWFGFVYSLPIALFGFFLPNMLFSAQMVNIFLLVISWFFFFQIGKKILPDFWNFFALFFFYIASWFLPFRSDVVSENIYIPLFLFLFLLVYNFMESYFQKSTKSKTEKKSFKTEISYIIALWCLMWLLYLTRAEAFIYIGSIWILALSLLFLKKLSLKKFFILGSIFFASFFLFIFPYLLHLHSITGEWWLTNKGASNLRQAELRGIDRMDDAGFEQAVWELTPDKKHLIAGFAGGMRYDIPQIEGSLKELIKKNPSVFIIRIFKNDIKLISQNLPEIFLWKSLWLYKNGGKYFENYFFLSLLFIPLMTLIFWIIKIFQKQKLFSLIFASFFLIATLFFTIFFILNRYFIIFLPFFILAFIFWISEISRKKFGKIFSSILLFVFLIVQSLSAYSYYNAESVSQDFYTLKKTAGIWLWNFACENISEQKLKNICKENLWILERFPIVTYYSGAKYRWITPYTDSLEDILIYARYNTISYLVVDSMDFLEYRPKLSYLLQWNDFPWLTLVKEFTNEKNQKVHLFFINSDYATQE